MAAKPSALEDLASTTAPPAPSVRPVLASSLLQAALARYRRDGPERRVVLSGWRELDEYVLLGGLEKGWVVGVSGDLEDGVGRMLSLHVLITCLLSNPEAKASIIDTTGSFPVSLLAQIIDHRLNPRPNVKGIRRLGAGAEANQKVQEILERVSISRVFDIDGVWEVLSEVSRDCHTHVRGPISVDRGTVEVENQEMPVLPKESSLRTYPHSEDDNPEKVLLGQEKEIFDSQDDDEEPDIEAEVEESITLSQEILGKPKHASELPDIPPTSGAEPVDSTKELRTSGTTEIIIIDNMTTCIGELFSKRERTSAHTLLQALSRTLSTISQTNSILTLLINSVIDPSKPHPSNTHQHQHHPPTSIPSKTNPSVFSATTSRPALGRIFDNFVSLHLLISKIPKTARDAEIFYGPSLLSHPPPTPSPPPRASPDAGSDSHAAQQPAAQHAHIIEVLKDTVPDLEAWLDSGDENRAGQRPPSARRGHSSSGSRKKKRRTRTTQRWAPFVVSSDGLTLLDAFPALVAGKKGGAAGGAAVAASARGDMHIVKQFPFGRRV